jgi:hypothetical protein
MGEAGEGTFCGDHVQAGVLHGDQQARLGRMRIVPIAVATVLLQRRDRAGVQDELTGLAVLAANDRESAVDRIEMVSVQAVGLARPQPSHRQQPDQRPVGQRGRPVAHPPCRPHQGDHLVVAEQVGRGAGVLAREQIGRRHLVHGIEGVQVDGEAPYGAQPQPMPVGCGALRRRRPRDDRVDGEARDAQRVEMISEVQQQPTGLFQFVTQGPAHPQIPLRGLAHHAHQLGSLDSLSGQGRTSSARAARSSLA